MLNNITKITLLFLFITCNIFAQNSKVRIAQTYIKPHYYKLKDAKKSIDAAIINEKTINKAKTWKVRGEVYLAIAQTDDYDFKSLSDNPLQVSYFSYSKALKLDTKNKYRKDIEKHLEVVDKLLINKAIDKYNNKRYNEALSYFESALGIDTLIKGKDIDTLVIYNTAITAEKALFYDKAIKYYQKTADLGYKDVDIYGYMANIESKRGDTIQYLNYLKEGIRKYPDKSQNLTITLIYYYLDNDKADIALEYINKAISKDPQNPIFYFIQGALYDYLDNYENAKIAYENAIRLDSNYFDAYYNIGLLYFNKGTKLLKEANNIPPNQKDKYEVAIKESYKELEKAIPYLEKAHEINPDSKDTNNTLREIYFKLRNDN
jgi:tetratricopeptide (TPR) repeat protein